MPLLTFIFLTDLILLALLAWIIVLYVKPRSVPYDYDMIDPPAGLLNCIELDEYERAITE